ncbi:Crp/Fnr family transcriptional regulator [Aequorivita ciconiae]|nr:Crp/Fnr family transcriptional regulator [Aequorivita sp. H23M31]
MAGISEAHSDTLYESLEKADFPKGEMLLREGEVCRHSFFVEEGLLRSYTLGEDGKEHLIQFAPENWFIVDRGSVYFKDTSEIYIEAIEDSKVVLLDKNFMDRATQLDENFRKFNEKLLHNHIRHIQQRLNLLLSASAENRYLSFIETYPDLLLRVPQWMIASYLGITPESLSRVRKELAHRNS